MEAHREALQQPQSYGWQGHGGSDVLTESLLFPRIGIIFSFGVAPNEKGRFLYPAVKTLNKLGRSQGDLSASSDTESGP